MSKFIVVFIWALLVIANAKAFDVRLLANNKEAYSRELTNKDASVVANWVGQHSFKPSDLRAKSVASLAATFTVMEKIDTTCELGLIKQLRIDAKKNKIISHDDHMFPLISYLREQNLIDDILFKLMRDSLNVEVDMLGSLNDHPSRPFNAYTRQNADIDTDKFYASMKKWPDDIKKCTFDSYFNMVRALTWKDAKDRDGQVRKLNYLAYVNGSIDLATYNKLETLRKHEVLDWPVYFSRYADLINNSKDKLTKNPETRTDNDFTVEYVSKKERLTQRGNLYRTFNSTQVMILAQILEKTAKRMDARHVTLNWQYTDDPNGETEVYIFSPMEQYRAAIKMLRKDMAEVMRSSAFQNVNLEYDHLIAAAYETGFIRSEELDQVLKFEDFWNPETPKWKAYANFAFSLAGTASFYLPPPWNIIGAIGLVLTQTKLLNGDKQPDPDENWNVIL